MNTLKYVQEKSDKKINYIKSHIYKNYIKTVIESNNNDQTRIMFIANRFKSDFNNPMTKECNGLIFEYDNTLNTYNFLVIPTELFNSQPLNKSEIGYFYNQNIYNIYPVYDGTIINLYYYNNEWKISTNKAYDANKLIFTNNKTYKDVLDEILTAYPNFSYDLLEKNKCYTLCMKYIQYHPFIENLHCNNNKVVLLQSVDLYEFNKNNKLVINENENIELPNCYKVEKGTFKNINNIYNILNNEISRYKNEKNLSKYSPIFGFILRSTNFNNTKNYSNILLESNLMVKIRNLIYNHSFIKNLNFYNVLEKTNNILINKNYYNILNLITLKVFLTKKDLNLFILLFPESKLIMKNYTYIFKYMAKYLIKNYTIFMAQLQNIDKILKNSLVIETTELESVVHINHLKLNKLLLIILLDLNNKKINLNVHENYDILYDCLTNMVYIDYFYSYFYN